MSMMTVDIGEGIRGSVVPVPGSTTSTPPVTQPSGFALPTLDLPNFTLAYIEDFDRPVAESPLTTNGAASLFDGLYGVQPNNDLPGGIKTVIGAYPSSFLDSSKRGRYGTSILSVAEGSSVLQERIRYEAGWPRVCALVPRLGNVVPGVPYGTNDFLGGAIELVWRTDVVNSYKFVPLLWPYSNHSRTADGLNADGEIDFPEFNQYGGAHIGGFAHYQGDINTDNITEQSSYGSATVVGAGSGWHKTRTEWIAGVPSVAHPTRSIGGSIRFVLDDVVVKTIIGSPDGVTPPFIPEHPMHWVIQQETNLSGLAVDTSATGNLSIDWLAFYYYHP